MSKQGQSKNMSHSEFVKAVGRIAEAYGAKVLVIAGGNVYQQPGLPDRRIVHREFSAFVEFKVGRDSLSTAQRIVVRDCNDRNDPAYVLHLDQGWITGIITSQERGDAPAFAVKVEQLMLGSKEHDVMRIGGTALIALMKSGWENRKKL